jgi:hypothetical protein
MYTHRTTSIATDATEVDDVTVGNDYIEVPINLRYNFSLPFLGSYVSPFLTTGPDFSFLMSNENVKDAWNNKKVDFAWNFGIGLKLVDKIEIAASYGLGLKNSASGDSALYGNNIADGKNRFWTVTAAWLF